MQEEDTGAGALSLQGRPVQTKNAKRPKSPLVRWLLWTAAIFLVLLAAAGVTIAVLLHRAEPMLRASLIDTLQKRFHSRVELDDMHVSIVDGFQVEANGLRVWLPPEAIIQSQDAAPSNSSNKPNAANVDVGSPSTPPQAKAQPLPADSPAAAKWRTQPWIVVGKLRFHASWRILPGEPIVISVIHVQDVRVLLPPKDERPHMTASGIPPGAKPNNPGSSSPGNFANPANTTTVPAQANNPTPHHGLFSLPRVIIQRVECQDALLEIERKQEPGKPPKIPLDFELKNIVLTPDGRGGPVAFVVDMVNAKPIGLIHSTGHFGPWVPGDPGALPVDGGYSFDHADLGTIKGIAGILSSTGQYKGTLRRIEADGQTQTPDFRLERVSRGSGVLLTTRFHAIVDGTNGNTWLQPVDAMLGRTHIVARGQVLRAEDANGQKHGHDIVLEVKIDRGRIDDILRIAANRDAPFMTGNLTLGATHFHLPPSPEGQQVSVWDRLQLDGSFHLSQARFSSDKVQDRIEELSLRGQGKPKEVKTTDPTSIQSDMQGHFKLYGGMLQLPDLDYHVPGADIVVHGTYGLRAGTLAFDGDAKLQASISAIVGGWKGILLTPLDRFLKKNGAGTDVPIHLDGTRKDPKFGVDFNRLGKTEEPPKPSNQTSLPIQTGTPEEVVKKLSSSFVKTRFQTLRNTRFWSVLKEPGSSPAAKPSQKNRASAHGGCF